MLGKIEKKGCMMLDKIQLLNDQPIGGIEKDRKDGLGFLTYSDIITSMIKGTPGPFTIGIFGEWGTGKTSLLRLIRDNLSEDCNFIPVWFNAWMYEKEEHPLLPLISTIVKQINENKDFWTNIEEKKSYILNALRAVAYGFSSKSKLKIPGFAEIEASFVAKDMIERESEFSYDPLLDKAIYYNSFDKLSSIKLSSNKKIVIFIDDLDRCFPDKAIKLLESIKLVLFQKGFIFVLGVARQIIEGYLKHRYKEEYGVKEFEGQKYLDKIVQLSFPIPPHTQRIKGFSSVLLNQLKPKDKSALEPILPIVGAACAYNPRGTVRFINNLIIDRAISNNLSIGQGSEDICIGYFAITRGLQQRWAHIFNDFFYSDDLCQKIAILNQDDINEDEIGTDNSIKNIVNELLQDRDLREFILSKQGKNWLKNKELRDFAVNFLSTQRQEVVGDDFFDTSALPKNLRTPMIRAYQLARELNMTNTYFLEIIKPLDLGISSHMSTLSEDKEIIIRQFIDSNKPIEYKRKRIGPEIIRKSQKDTRNDMSENGD
ncbi:MAG: hypothetical protein GY874_12430 [Desulfobacteraceae bacterium]|nr:hypothetical protein [Desulfobacteraceae bacterium]